MIPIAAICCTFGRTEHLSEAIQSFLNQDYAGEREMIVLNTCREQTLVFNHPLVKIINSPVRPATMGETRNLAIDHAREDALCVTLDDDDHWLPWHISNVVRGFDPAVHGWTRLSRQFYMEGHILRGVTNGTCNTVSYTKKAWNAAGKFPMMNCGEDRAFIGRLSATSQGITVELHDHEASYIYVWAQGESVYHLSGLGNDVAGKPNGMERAQQALQKRIREGKEPVGEIRLTPHWKQDYTMLASKLTNSVALLKTRRRSKVGIVQLGHYGDILNVLPIAKWIADAHEKPLFFVAQKYSSILDGIDYVTPVVLNLDDQQVTEAEREAQRKCEYVLLLQRYGHGHAPAHSTYSYNTDQWRESGLLNKFCELPLVLPCGDMQGAIPDTTRPIVLVHLTGGHSSPFPHGAELLAHLKAMWGQRVEFIDLASITAPNIRDMRYLMDLAALLISSDTYALHLAKASDVPVVAIVNDGTHPFGTKWLESSLRYQPEVEVGYSEALARINDISKPIKHIARVKRRTLAQYSPPRKTGRIIHCVQVHPGKTELEKRRKQKAMDSWNTLYAAGVEKCHVLEVDRTSRSIGDNRDLPFLKDVLSVALQRAQPDDIVVFTNDDIVLHPELPAVLRLHIGIWDACTSRRAEFKTRDMPDLSLTPEEIAELSDRHCGRDLFAARKSWWESHWDELGDPILGAPTFDLHLAAIVRRDKGFRLNRRNLEDIVIPCELPLGYVLHQFHPPVWGTLPAHTPSHAHNSRSFETWAKEQLPELKFYNGAI